MRRCVVGLPLLLTLLTAGCDCSPPPVTGCTSDLGCNGDLVCVDGQCVAPTLNDSGPRDAGAEIDAGPIEQDAGRACPSMTLCGSPAVCCDVGDECIEGACLAACESGVRCGADRTTCCGDGQVCVSGDCTDPGDVCTDSFECPIGQFCEPTLGRCLPQFDPVTCMTTPVFGAFSAEIEWSAETAVDQPTCMNGISAPIVVDLTGDGRPEVVANFACESDWQHGALRAYSGDGTILWTAAEQINGRSGIAGADIDNDGRAEVISVGGTGGEAARIFAFDDDGSVLWRSTAADGTTDYVANPSPVNSAPSIADLDGDGSPEIIWGALVFDATGRLLWASGAGAREGTNGTYWGGISAVADIDLDGDPEIVTGARAWEADGTMLWDSGTADGYPAIANVDDDPQPEIALVASGNIYILDGMTGAPQGGPLALPGGGIGGPPTIADFDGDGEPEVGIAGAGSYSVYDDLDTATLTALWSIPTQDNSSNATGSSVFDFEGDGAAEVVYADECFLRVYRGSDGMVLLEEPNLSATIHEYPLVADVDADGNSEIVIVANDRDVSSGTRDSCIANYPGWTGERRGLFVYGDTRDQWVRTRRIWNQHAYHVTNVSADGTVPAVEADNWSTPGLNNYRQNAQGEGVFNAPDLAVLALEVVIERCPSSATLRARITNEGNLGAPAGVDVSFYAGTPNARGALLGTVPTTVPLLPGESTLVELADVELAGDPPFAFVAVVDDDGSDAGTLTECDEDNNAEGIGDIDCSILE